MRYFKGTYINLLIMTPEVFDPDIKKVYNSLHQILKSHLEELEKKFYAALEIKDKFLQL